MNKIRFASNEIRFTSNEIRSASPARVWSRNAGRLVLGLALAMAASLPARAFQAGLTQLQTPGATAEAPTVPVALFYPTDAAEREIVMGPVKLNIAPRAEPRSRVKGLIVLSHGTGGSELGHPSLAQALARSGYLVAALRHPGDNWQDRSLLHSTTLRYFDERPRQVSRVIDALLADPAWRDRIARDEKGPKIGALGHSAGGYTVLALAGGRPDVSLLVSHCREQRAEDPIFCSLREAPPQPDQPDLVLKDPRVRAVVAMSPVGAVFSAASLATISVPAAIYVAEKDRFLVPRFHGLRIARELPGADLRPVPNAWHFAFMDTPTLPIRTEDGDIGADPAGFDRAAFLSRLGTEIPEFFNHALR